MVDTKEKIMRSALRMFARDGYEAASVSDIAGELGMTKGALYKHYKNKRAIFDSIVERIYRVDAERAKKFEVPEDTFDKSPSSYRDTAVDKIKVFLEAQFRFWTEDEFACDFRKMLTVEQYRNPQIMELYQKCLGSGPVSYMEDLFREMMERNIGEESDLKQLALELYAPFYLLVSISDATSDEKEAVKLLTTHIERFFEKNVSTEKMPKAHVEGKGSE